MKFSGRLKLVLLMAAMTVLMAALPVQAEGSIKLQVDGIGKDGKVPAGQPLTFRASGGEKNKSTYMLIITVDGNEARYPMNDNGYLSLSTGSMDSNWSTLPVGLHYEVQALNYRYLSQGDPYMYSETYTFDVVYPEPDYYKLEVYESKQFDIDYWAGQYVLSEPPILYKKTGATLDRTTGMTSDNWVEYLSPQELGAVFRYEITDASGKVVSRDGLVKGVGTYHVKAYELFRDPMTGKTVKVAAEPVGTKIVDASEIKPSVDPDVLGGADGKSGLYDDIGDLSGSIGGILDGHMGEDLGSGSSFGDLFSGLVDDIVNGPREPESESASAPAPAAASTPVSASAPAPAAEEPAEPAKVVTLAGQSSTNAVVKFQAVEEADGYQIVYGTTKSLKKNVKKVSTKKTRATLKKLSKKKTYYVKVRAYVIDENGKKVYGEYSATKKIKR